MSEAFCDTVIALGTFDGLHEGHRSVISRACEEAKKTGAESMAYTFRESPKNGLGQRVRQLMTPEQKERKMRELGIDRVVNVDFTPAIRDMSPRDFARMLAEEYHMRTAVIGEDFRFGKDAAGDGDMMREFGREMGFDVITVRTVMCGDRKMSSTLMREELDAREKEHDTGYRTGPV